MLKPDSIEKGNIGPILEKITASGFRIVAMKLTQLTIPDAQAFYAVHKDRPFFEDLVHCGVEIQVPKGPFLTFLNNTIWSCQLVSISEKCNPPSLTFERLFFFKSI